MAAAPGQPWSPKFMSQTMDGNQVIQMEMPNVTIPGCPPGLEYLVQLDQVLVKQVVEVFEAITGFEMRNRYRIFNTMNQQCFYVEEETDTCHRIMCGPGRGFVLHVTDNTGREVLKVRRDFKCCAGCCWCASAEACYHELIIETPMGECLGYVRQKVSCWKGAYILMDANHQVLGTIEGPCCPLECPNMDLDYPVISADGSTEIGTVKKQWSGCTRECFTTADDYSITFPKDMDVRMKAVMFSAAFLIDFMFFENKNNN